MRSGPLPAEAIPSAVRLHRPFRTFSVALFLVLCLLGSAALLVVPALGAERTKAQELKRAISKERERASEQERIMLELTRKERELFGDLANLEDRVNALTLDVREQERKLSQVQDRQKEIFARYETLIRERDATAARLKRLLAILWPVQAGGLRERMVGLSSWEAADRRFTWLGAIYGRTNSMLEGLHEKSRELALNLAEQDRIEKDLRERLDRIDSRKTELLDAKLELLKNIQLIRAELVDQEQELTTIISTIESLDYRLKMLTTKKIASFKGSLRWPVQGRIVAGFSPAARTPVRGVGISTSEGARVRTVSWGKVVHNDLLRGFGRVVIIFHGQDYYSLYAFLSDSFVKVGQDVEKDEDIGVAGYYPKADGPGLYFELRFGQKPINPKLWLSKR